MHHQAAAVLMLQLDPMVMVTHMAEGITHIECKEGSCKPSMAMELYASSD